MLGTHARVAILISFTLCLALAHPALGYVKKNVVTDCGAVGNGVTDDTAAVQACIDAAELLSPGAVYFPPGNYRIAGSLKIEAHYVTLYADATSTAKLTHAGCGSNDTLITAATPTFGPNNGAVRHLWLVAADSSCRRTAIRLVDAGAWHLEDLVIQGFHDASTETSEGLRTEGRDELTVRDVTIRADRPIVIKKNPHPPNSDADHFHFENITSRVGPESAPPTQERWHIEVDPDVIFTAFTLDGANPFIRGCGILRWVGTASAVSHTLRIANVRHEQRSPTSCDKSIYIDRGVYGSNAALQTLLIENVYFSKDVGNAIHLKNVTGATVADSIYSPTSSTDFIELVSGVRMLELRNNFTTTNATITRPGMIWLEAFGGKLCCPATVDSGVLVQSGQTQPTIP